MVAKSTHSLGARSWRRFWRQNGHFSATPCLVLEFFHRHACANLHFAKAATPSSAERRKPSAKCTQVALLQKVIHLTACKRRTPPRYKRQGSTRHLKIGWRKTSLAILLRYPLVQLVLDNEPYRSMHIVQPAQWEWLQKQARNCVMRRADILQRTPLTSRIFDRFVAPFLVLQILLENQVFAHHALQKKTNTCLRIHESHTHARILQVKHVLRISLF